MPQEHESLVGVNVILSHDDPYQKCENYETEDEKKSRVVKEFEDKSPEHQSDHIRKIPDHTDRSGGCICVNLFEVQVFGVEDIIFFEKVVLTHRHTSSIPDTVKYCEDEDDKG